MDKETTTSVTIDRKTFARLDRLAKSNNVSKKDFLSCALEYFEKYGINPVEHESPAKENRYNYYIMYLFTLNTSIFDILP